MERNFNAGRPDDFHCYRRDSLSDFFFSILGPLHGLDDVLDFSEGKHASIKLLLDMIIRGQEDRLHRLARAVEQACGEVEVCESPNGELAVRFKERVHA